MLLPFLTAAGGTRVPRRPRWGYRTQGVLRWTGFGLCLVVLAREAPWSGSGGGLGWSPALAWSSLLLTTVGGFAGMGSPRDAPDLPRPGAR